MRERDSEVGTSRQKDSEREKVCVKERESEKGSESKCGTGIKKARSSTFYFRNLGHSSE